MINFINDNSTDNTWNLIKQLNSKDNKVKGTKLSRNFGHQAAVDAGISMFDSDALILMDGDLQDDPKYILDFVREWENGSKIILAKRVLEKKIYLEKSFSKSFKIQKQYQISIFLKMLDIFLYWIKNS